MASCNCDVGNLTADGIGDLNGFRYRGYYYDTDIGKYYLRTRWYDPETGRFISMDDILMVEHTVTFPNGLNLYVYAGNNPVMNVDDDGMIFRRAMRNIGNAARTVANAVSSVARAGVNVGANFLRNISNTLTGGARNPAPVIAPIPPPAKFKPPTGFGPDAPYTGFPGLSPDREGGSVGYYIGNFFRNTGNWLSNIAAPVTRHIPRLPTRFLPRLPIPSRGPTRIMPR